MAMVPLQAVFEGDIVVLLVLVDDQDPMHVVAGKVAHHAAGVRVPALDRPLAVTFQGRMVDDDATTAAAGIGPLDVVRVGYR
jgi:toluene monooxygenase system protein B